MINMENSFKNPHLFFNKCFSFCVGKPLDVTFDVTVGRRYQDWIPRQDWTEFAADVAPAERAVLRTGALPRFPLGPKTSKTFLEGGLLEKYPLLNVCKSHGKSEDLFWITYWQTDEWNRFLELEKNPRLPEGKQYCFHPSNLTHMGIARHISSKLTRKKYVLFETKIHSIPSLVDPDSSVLRCPIGSY